MHRRKFLGAGAALAALATPRWILGQGCPATETDRYGMGPFYLANAPARACLARTGEPGESLSIAGTVSNCRQPLPGVRLEVWQATHSGCYIHPSMACDDAPGDDGEARLWGVLVSDAEGRFAFDTIKPGRYLNGSRYRPSHIHFRVTAPGKRVFADGQDNFFTQLYFAGDPFIAGDYAADHPGAASRIIPLSREAGGPWRGTFDINLPAVPDAGARARDPFADAAMAGFDAAVRRQGGRILFHLPSLPAGETVEMRVHGVDGRLARRSLHRLNPIELDADALPPGTYQAEFRWWTGRGPARQTLRFQP